MGSIVRSLGIVAFIRVRPVCCWVHSGRAFVFVRARPGGCRPGSLGSFGRGLGFSWVRWVHSGVPWWSLGSFRFVVFIVARAERRRVN